MLNYIFDILQSLNIPGWRLFGYTSFRALIAIVLALLISAIFGEYFIRYFKKKQISETLRDLDKNNLKVGVPTMGGLIIIVAILVPCLLIGRLNNVYMILLIITTVWLGIVGFADDYIKTFKKNKDGIPGKVKVVSQVGLGLLIGLTLYFSPQAVMRENISIEKGDAVEVLHKEKAQYVIQFDKNVQEYKDYLDVSEEELSTAKKFYVNMLESSFDSAGAMVAWSAAEGYDGTDREQDEFIKDILNVTKEDVVRVAGNINSGAKWLR